MAGGLCLFGALPKARGDSTDVSLLFVTKTQLYLQNSPANPTLRANPFAFEAGATPARANSIVSGQFTPTGGATRTLAPLGGGNFFFDGGTFSTQAALDAAFPNGTYSFGLQTVTAPTSFSDSVSITGNTYPTNVPKLLNGTWSNGGLQVDATQNYLFTWNDIAPFVSPNRMILEILDGSNKVIFSRVFNPDPSGFNINFTLPANTLQAGSFYTGKLTFERRQVVTTGALSKVGTYAVETSFKIATIGAIPAVTGPTAPMGTVGQLFVYQIVADNHPFTYSVSALPAGLTLDSTLGIIYGTPTTAQTVPATVSATNINGTGTKSISTTIQAAPTSGPVIVSSTSAHYFTGQPFTFQVVTKGATSAARITATGLPAGLTLDPVSGKISGITNSVGSFTVNLSVKDGSFSVAGFLQLTFTSDPGYPVITNANTVLLPKNQPFNYQIATPGATDPNDPVVYNMIGQLPAGLGFDSADGVISGIYTGPVAPSRADGGGDPSDIKPLSGGAVLGSIQLFGTNSHGTSTFQLLFLAQPTGAVNISTRLLVGANDNVMIGGFIITGNTQKVVIIRAIGPSLGIPGALQDPVLELHDSANNVVTNDNWRSTQEQIIKDTTIPPSDDREAAIVIALDPGNYTAIVSGKNGTTGIGLVELFDLGTATLDSSSKAQLAQISTRGNVLGGDNVMIGGFIITGATTKVIVRAIGPSLKNFGVTNACPDTTLELFNGSGTSLALNDDWRSTQEQAIKDTTVPPTDDKESAIVNSLAPGNYTAIVRGKNNATGVALVEVFGLP